MDALGTSLKDLQTENLRKQLDNLAIGDNKPAIYEGQSYRSLFSRMAGHQTKYNTPSGQPSSFMWHHTVSHHNSIIGPNRGSQDYKCIIVGYFSSNCSRLVHEGWRQGIMESYQSKGAIISLNSKLDFVQPLRTQLTVISKSKNVMPGIPDKVQDNVIVAQNMNPDSRCKKVSFQTNSTNNTDKRITQTVTKLMPNIDTRIAQTVTKLMPSIPDKVQVSKNMNPDNTNTDKRIAQTVTKLMPNTPDKVQVSKNMNPDNINKKVRDQTVSEESIDKVVVQTVRKLMPGSPDKIQTVRKLTPESPDKVQYRKVKL